VRIHSITDNTLRSRIKPDGSANTVAAGQTSLTSDAIDMLLYECALIQIVFGTITGGAVTSIKLQHSDDNSAWNDVKGSNITVADTSSNKVFEYDVFRPLKRYLRTVISRATQNSAIDGEYVMLFRGMQLAPTQGATIVSTSKLNGTATGTP
jgi:hypothetical protein